LIFLMEQCFSLLVGSKLVLVHHNVRNHDNLKISSAYYSQMRWSLKEYAAISKSYNFLLKSDNISPALTSVFSWRIHQQCEIDKCGFISQRDSIPETIRQSGVQRWFQYVGSVKNLLSPGMISGFLLRTNFLRKFSLYFSPSAWLSKIPAALFSLVHLTSGFPVMFLIKENAQIPTATPVAANKGYTSGLNQRLAIEIAEQMIRTREIEGGRRRLL